MAVHESLHPGVGDILALRLSQEDAADIIPWLAAKGLHKGEWSNFLRQILRQRIALEQNPVGAISQAELAHMVSNLVRDALLGANVTLPGGEAAPTPQSPEPAITATVMSRLRALSGDDEDDDEDD